MPAVDSTSTAADVGATTPSQAPAPGFAAVLARAGDQELVTLGEMVGLDPVAPSAFSASAGAATAAYGATASDSGLAAEHPVIEAASAYLGVPYLWGGTDPETGLDCSGLVQRAFADLGIDVPRVSADQAKAGAAVDDIGAARPGDLVYWAGRGGRPNHIGIYLGEGKMLHAPRTGDVVKVADVRDAPPDAIRRVS